MRMWMVNPQYMCNHHLLGEHREIHMIVGYLQNKNHLYNYAYHGLVQVSALSSRHQQLVRELQRRGYKHNTPLQIDYNTITQHLFIPEKDICINPLYSLNVLLGRCSQCRYKFLQYYNIIQYYIIWEEKIVQQPNVNRVSDMPKRFQIDNALSLLSQLIT